MRSDLRKPVVLLTPDEEHDLLIRAQAGDIVARNELIERNIPFLLFVATRRHRACRHRVDRDDLAHAGCIGFIRAIEKFKIGRGRLITYAQHWVRSAIDDAIDQAALLRIPRSTLEKINRGEPVQLSTALAVKFFAEPHRLNCDIAGVAVDPVDLAMLSEIERKFS